MHHFQAQSINSIAIDQFLKWPIQFQSILVYLVFPDDIFQGKL